MRRGLSQLFPFLLGVRSGVRAVALLGIDLVLRCPRLLRGVRQLYHCILDLVWLNEILHRLNGSIGRWDCRIMVIFWLFLIPVIIHVLQILRCNILLFICVFLFRSSSLRA